MRIEEGRFFVEGWREEKKKNRLDGDNTSTTALGVLDVAGGDVAVAKLGERRGRGLGEDADDGTAVEGGRESHARENAQERDGWCPLHCFFLANEREKNENEKKWFWRFCSVFPTAQSP